MEANVALPFITECRLPCHAARGTGRHITGPERINMAVSKNASAARKEVLDMLIEDHKSAKKLFREFEKLSEQDLEERESLVSLACTELKLHTQLEEECFYPALRGALKEQDLLEEAEVEHASAKQLIEQLDGLDADDPKFAATFKVLGEYVKHHIKEEEGDMFEQCQRAKVDWPALLEQMTTRRTELEMELGLAEDAMEESEGAVGTQPVGSAMEGDEETADIGKERGGRRETID
jgi:hypothetical protein